MTVEAHARSSDLTIIEDLNANWVYNGSNYGSTRGLLGEINKVATDEADRRARKAAVGILEVVRTFSGVAATDFTVVDWDNPVITNHGSYVEYSYPVREPNDAEKEAYTLSLHDKVVLGLLKDLYELAYKHENDIRTLNSQPNITLGQFSTGIDALNSISNSQFRGFVKDKY